MNSAKVRRLELVSYLVDLECTKCNDSILMGHKSQTRKTFGPVEYLHTCLNTECDNRLWSDVYYPYKEEKVNGKI